MRPYLSVLSARIRMLLQYRAAALAGMSTQLFWGLIRVMIFEAFYRTATQAQPMTYAEVVNYVWLGQALFALLPWQPDNDIRTMVRTGTVAYELVRPVDLYTFWYSRSLANRIAPALLRSVPLAGELLPSLFTEVFFGLQLTYSPPRSKAATSTACYCAPAARPCNWPDKSSPSSASAALPKAWSSCCGPHMP